jgi:DNA-binding MarR family transcriptional regulator
MIETTVDERLAQLSHTCVNLNLRKASRAVSNYYDDVFLAACGLRATQIPPLVVLYLSGPRSINDIAEILALDRTTLTRNLRPLEKARLLEIAPGKDQRTRVVKITEPGKQVLANVLPVWEEAQAHMVNGLGDRFNVMIDTLTDITKLTSE